MKEALTLLAVIWALSSAQAFADQVYEGSASLRGERDRVVIAVDTDADGRPDHHFILQTEFTPEQPIQHEFERVRVVVSEQSIHVRPLDEPISFAFVLEGAEAQTNYDQRGGNCARSATPT